MTVKMWQEPHAGRREVFGTMSADVKPTNQFNGVKIFSATMAQDRDRLGDRITEWVRAHPSFEIVDTVVTQSSDEAFHCLAITIFYNEPTH